MSTNIAKQFLQAIAKKNEAGIQINRIFNIDIAIFQKINIDIDIARAIYCSSNILPEIEVPPI